MAQTVFKAVSPRSLLRAIEVTAFGFDEVYAFGLRRRHPWNRVGAVRWLGHGRAVVCCDGGNVELAGIDDVAAAVAAIEASLSGEGQGEFRWPEAASLERRWQSQSLPAWVRPKVVIRAWLSLMCAVLAMFGWGRDSAMPVLLWSGAVGLAVLAWLTAVTGDQLVTPIRGLVDAYGIQFADSRVPWRCIRSWHVEPGHGFGMVRVRIETTVGPITSPDLLGGQARELSDLLDRLPRQMTSPLRPAGPEPLQNTALSLVRMADDPATDRGLSLSAGDEGPR